MNSNNSHKSQMVPVIQRPFKALKTNSEYQSLDNEPGLETQFPPKKFPAALARYVLVFEIDDDWRNQINEYEANKKTDNSAHPPSSPIAFPLIDKLRSADMIVQEFYGKNKDKYFALISISEKRQKMLAELMGIKLRVKKADDETNQIKRDGAWSAYKQYLNQVYERCSEGTIFSSCQQCQMIEYLLNDQDVRAIGPQLIQKESCEPGNTPLMQLKKDERIKDYFYMHHPGKRSWLNEAWAHTYTKRQPIEDLREYFGESIALYFSWMGFLTTVLWVPAFTGLFVFIMGLVAFGSGGTFDNPYVPLYCIFMSVWSIIVSNEWKNLERTWQYQWGTLDLPDSEADRTQFVQDKRTYKRLNELLEKEEYYPDPLWRWVALILTCVALPLMVAVNINLFMSVDMFEAAVAPSAGGKLGPMAYLGAVLHGAVYLGLGYLFEKFALEWLTSFENWRTETEYTDAKVAKYAFYFHTTAYFSMFFWGFIWNRSHVGSLDLTCKDGICYDYLMIKIPTFFFTIYFGGYLIRFLDRLVFRGAGLLPSGPDEDEGDEGDMVPAEDMEVEQQRPANFERDSHKPELAPWEVTGWYLSKLIDVGFVVLFSGAFPLLPLALLLVQLYELRDKARHVLSGTQRPRYMCSKGLGSVNEVLDIQVTAGILTQCCILAFSSNGLVYYLPSLSAADRILCAAVVEHLLLLFKIVWDGSMNAVPADVVNAFERRQNEKEAIMREMDHYDPTESVLFYTSDDGEGFYGK